MAEKMILGQKIDEKDPIIPEMGRQYSLLAGLGIFLFLLGMIFTTPALWAQDPSPMAGSDSSSGESCVYLQQQRKEICKKSAETCTEVHRLDALNLIKNCAQLAQECDVLGTREDVTCQPGGNGRVTLHH